MLSNQSIPLAPLIIAVTILVICLLCFYKLTLKIDKEKVTAIFGVGFIKKSISLKEIDSNSIEEVSIPWYYGIGIRLTSKGWLYNVKIGNAIFIKNKTGTKTFLVGTDDFEKFLSIIKKLTQ